MILGTFDKQPSEVLDYDIDFSLWIPAGDSISSVVAVLEDSPDSALLLTGTAGSTIINGLFVKQWVYEGTNRATYKIQLTATSAQGRVKEVEFRVKVKET